MFGEHFGVFFFLQAALHISAFDILSISFRMLEMLMSYGQKPD
jgi:hypothetical protein